MKITKNFEHLQYCNFDTNFLKSENSENLKLLKFLDESTKIEKTTFPYEPALSEADVKTDRKGSTKWIYHKEQSFPSN